MRNQALLRYGTFFTVLTVLRSVIRTNNYLISVTFISFILYGAAAELVKQRLTLYRMVMPIGTPFLKEKINN